MITSQLLWRNYEEHKLRAGYSVYPYSGILLFMAPNFGAAELRILAASSPLKGWPLSDAAFTEQWRLNLIQASNLYSPTLQPAGSTTRSGGCRAGDASSMTFILLLLLFPGVFFPSRFLFNVHIFCIKCVCLFAVTVVSLSMCGFGPFNRLTAVYSVCCHHVVIHSWNSSIFCSDFGKNCSLRWSSVSFMLNWAIKQKLNRVSASLWVINEFISVEKPETRSESGSLLLHSGLSFLPLSLFTACVLPPFQELQRPFCHGRTKAALSLSAASPPHAAFTPTACGRSHSRPANAHKHSADAELQLLNQKATMCLHIHEWKGQLEKQTLSMCLRPRCTQSTDFYSEKYNIFQKDSSD